MFFVLYAFQTYCIRQSCPIALLVRRKSSEMSSTMKSRLEAFEAAREEVEENTRKQRLIEPEPGTYTRGQNQSRMLSTDYFWNFPDEKFREKLKNFQRISSRGELTEGKPDKGQAKAPPPPPLKYSQLIAVRIVLLYRVD